MNKLLFAAATAVLVLAGPALAKEQPFAKRDHVAWYSHRMMVQYDDLDLSTAVGRAELLSRIERAIKDGCEATERPINRDDCFKTVWAKSMTRAPAEVKGALTLAMTERSNREYANR